MEMYVCSVIDEFIQINVTEDLIFVFLDHLLLH